MIRKTIEGELYHEVGKFGDDNYRHIGFRDMDNKFGDMMESIVPEVGMVRKARIIIEIDEDDVTDDKEEE